ELLGLLNGLVDGIDVASYGEVATAAAAGFIPERLFHSNPIKKDTDIAICARHGVQWFTFDNADEIAKLCAYAPGANVLLRVAIKNESCVVNLGAKFGVNAEDALPLLLQARSAGINVRGIAFHVGSQSTDPEIYTSALKIVRRIFDDAAAAGVRLDTLDIGGGFPVNDRSAWPKPPGLPPRPACAWTPWISGVVFPSRTGRPCRSSRTSAAWSPAACPKCFPPECGLSPSRADASRATQ